MISILISVGVISLIAAVLAALLVLAEHTIADFGDCTITINAEKKLVVRGGTSLLEALNSEKIFIPSACGGRGTCAYCKLKVLDGGGPLMPTELPFLTDEERSSNVRISCQVKVRNDLAIEIPEELFAVKEFRGVVESIRDLTPDMKEIRIKLIEPDRIEFVPGQYVQLVAPAYGDNPEPVYRAYSLSNPPSDDGTVELIVRLVPGGICTTWIFTILKEGDEVTMNGPYGDFRLSDSDAEMIWIAGGSGMAPFWSIVRHMAGNNIQRKCTYFFGALTRKDVFLLDEFREIQKTLPNFRFVPALSSPDEGDTWTGETGLITEVVGRHVEAGTGAEAYLCGSGGMIEAACTVLEAKHIPKERQFYDSFT